MTREAWYLVVVIVLATAVAMAGDRVVGAIILVGVLVAALLAPTS